MAKWLRVLAVLPAIWGSHFLAAQDIEEVLIEAEWQEDSTLDLSESVEAFGLEDLETKQIAGFADVANEVPGLTSSPSGSQGLRFTLRGVGARDTQLGVESKIGLYVDGAFLGRASGLIFDIVDLANVEVFKGPQGFKHGRNSIGGSINMISAKADPEAFLGKVTVSVGNYNARKFTATVNVPFTESFALRGSILKNVRDGWVENRGLGEDFFAYDREGLRLAARWFASDTVTVDYAFDWSDSTASPVAYQTTPLTGQDSQGLLIVDDGDPTDFEPLLGPVTTERQDSSRSAHEIENGFSDSIGHSLVVEWNWADLHTFKFVGTYRETNVLNTFAFFPDVDDQEALNAALVSSPANSIIRTVIGTQFLLRQDSADNPFPLPGFFNLSILGTSGPGSAIWDAFWQGIAADTPANEALRQQYIDDWDAAVAAYGDPRDVAMDGDADVAVLTQISNAIGAPDTFTIRNEISTLFATPPGGLFGLRDHKQFSLEFQQTGYWLDETVEYHMGIYYFNERTGNGTDLPEGVFYGDIIEFLDFGAVVEENPDLSEFGFSFISFNRLNTDATGVYFNLSYTPDLWDQRSTMSAGLRWSKDDRTLRRQGLQAISLLPRGDVLEDEASWENFDPYIKFEYEATDEANIYASITSGFRGGNFNVLSRDRDGLRFKAETMVAYEVGLKGTFFDGFYELEAAMFNYDIKDGQETVINPLSPLTRNVVNADGFSRGIEIDNTLYLTEEVKLSFDYALLKSGSEFYQTPFVDIINPAEFSPDFINTQTMMPQGQDAADRKLSSFLADCSGGLRQPNLETGECLERKSNFGAPVNSWTTSLEYRLPTDFGQILATLSYNYKDEFFVNDTLQVDSRHLWNLRLSTSLELVGAEMRVALWSQNLFDNEYQIEKFELNNLVLDIASYGPPRTVGIDFIYEWF